MQLDISKNQISFSWNWKEGDSMITANGAVQKLIEATFHKSDDKRALAHPWLS